jgi:S-adenosyl-L-methionine hydrolase (adenosine-forming)
LLRILRACSALSLRLGGKTLLLVHYQFFFMIIALMTDFGTGDYFVAAMKGVILTINQNAKIIDITHEIAPQDIKSASFVLRNCYSEFPAKTIFAAIVDPGVGSDRRAILVETEKYFFVAPDNGLLSFVFRETKSFKVFEITNPKRFRLPVSRTFHGRDIFAPCAAHLSGGVPASEFGGETNDFIVVPDSAPRFSANGSIEAEIVFIDRFGNLVTNLKREDLKSGFSAEIGGRKIENQREFFAESEAGELFMIEGSAGFLEIAVFCGSAKNLLNAEVGQKFNVNVQN